MAFGLAKQNACLGCHATNKKIVGPSFESVAQKYQSDPNLFNIKNNDIDIIKNNYFNCLLKILIT
jgi:cytochrome c